MLRKPVLNALQRRSFVSTVLLTRNWENETVNVLKNEAKKRGLLQTGNKSTLVSRLRDFEREQVSQSGPPPVIQQQVRLASTTEVPGIPSSSRPSPIPPNYPKEFLDVKIPDVSQLPPEPPVEAPFVPDFWESSRVKAELAPPPPPESSPIKVLAVAGAATHIGGGPSHNLYSPESSAAAEPVTKDEPIPFSEASEEQKPSGLLSFLGIFLGTYIGAWWFTPQSEFAKEEVQGVEAPAKH
ncbi:hypothetical protein BDY19DRAFT_919440 [Irpex rosettiformis]|uniref:Uncharacterized protein n=1 Tax=Irpex rosettiformis TaxID=378272 RepID=A0ACB8UI19_9APHY|nr:hypothetical protein BDY19DRAFT_919440 [Irpex rosettiformis]